MILKGNRILIAPLGWGLGHATRCIPIINHLIENKKEVIIAAYGNSLSLLREEFPTLSYIEFEGLNIEYSNSNSQIWALLRQLPHIITSIRRENRKIKEIVSENSIETIISDNRFGLYGSSAYSIYITHQLMIKCPKSLKWCEPLLWRLHRKFIKRYNECWIPDYAGKNNLSGDLSHKYPLLNNTKFIGTLSRFEKRIIEWSEIESIATEFGLNKRYDNIVVISGPEPHRSNMQCDYINLFKESDQSSLIVCGTPDAKRENSIVGNVTVTPHLPTPLMHYYLQSSANLFCRSGYSSIMDLDRLGCHAHLTATPGQTEQEYLLQITSYAAQ